jgi:hypothetical protein
MVTNFYLSRSSLAAERSYSDGNESAESISGALGMFHGGWRYPTDAMSDSVIESIQEIVSEVNKAKRGLYPIPNVRIDGNTEPGL